MRSGSATLSKADKMADQAEVLEHDADPAAEVRQRVARRIGQFLAEQPDAAARRPLREVEQLEQRRLAGARRAGEEIEAAVARAGSRGRAGLRRPCRSAGRRCRIRRLPPACSPLPRSACRTAPPPCQARRIPVYPCAHRPGRGLLHEMILTCPSCGTQYVVKDGAIPPEGRQVRCASCKHSWHQDPGSDCRC